jgi:molybdopterin synthase sulfur carrier subunit
MIKCILFGYIVAQQRVPDMRITYFSWLRSKTGLSSEDIELPNGCRNISMLIDILSDRHPDLAAVANAEGSLRFTVNRRYVERDHPIQPADTVGLFPPVTGG